MGVWVLPTANSLDVVKAVRKVLPEIEGALPAGMKLETRRQPQSVSSAPKMNGTIPKNLEDVAFYSVRQLAELVRTKRVSSAALTEMYLERLKRYDPVLKFVITLTEDRAQAKAKEADREIAAGKYRGPRFRRAE